MVSQTLTDFRATGSVLPVMAQDGGLWPSCPPMCPQGMSSLHRWPGQDPAGVRSPRGLALAAHSLLCSHCPNPTQVTSIPFVPDCSCQNAHSSWERGLLPAFHNSTLNIVCSCRSCWRDWLLCLLPGTAAVSFCPCSEGSPLVLL